MGGLLERMRSSTSSPLIFLFYLFLVIFLKGSAYVVSVLEDSHDKQAGELTLDMIKKHMDKINKPATMTIESPDGDIIDCVDVRKQLAFDHPLLKNHKLQLVPSEMPKREKNDVSESRNEESVVRQVWHRNGTSCPKGTVPIRRTTVDDVLWAASLSDFGKKQPNMTLGNWYNRSGASLPDPNGYHEWAILDAKLSNVVFGATAAINVWNPYVEVDQEFSLSQLSVVAESYGGGDRNTIEAGWHVFPRLYRGDRSTRMFVFWTADGYQTTGCYNTQCAGFMQVDNRITTGAAISEAEITLTAYKDQKTGNWWLMYGNSTAVGYWPAELFTRLEEGATQVQWGGEVLNTRPNGVHTATQMGSGQFAQEGYGKASYFRRLGLVDSSNTIVTPPSSSLIPASHTTSNCYSIMGPLTAQDNTSYFYYGGPGRDPKCLLVSSSVAMCTVHVLE